MSKLKIWCVGAALALWAVAAPALAQPAATKAARPAVAKPLFADNAPIAFTLEAPFSSLVSEAREDTTPRPAAVKLTAGGPAGTFPIQIYTRGKSRRVGGICTFPPIGLAFAKPSVKGTLFQGQQRLKLVSFCKTPPEFEQYVVREYLAYRLYNVLTPQSFRVRAAQVTYHDTENVWEDRTRFAYVIEDVDDLARRNGLKEVEVEVRTVSYAQLDAAASARYALFQYMIGNLDWDFTGGVAGTHCCHNTRLLGHDGVVADLVPAPYDFDFSGFVNAPYAAPPPNVPVSSVRDRYYRGLCRANDQLPAAIALFRAKRAELMAVVARESHLDAAARADITAYLDAFFDGLNDEARMREVFTGQCRA